MARAPLGTANPPQGTDSASPGTQLPCLPWQNPAQSSLCANWSNQISCFRASSPPEGSGTPAAPGAPVPSLSLSAYRKQEVKIPQPGELQVRSGGKSCATLHIHHTCSAPPCRSCGSGGQGSFVLWQEAAASSRRPSLRHRSRHRGLTEPLRPEHPLPAGINLQGPSPGWHGPDGSQQGHGMLQDLVPGAGAPRGCKSQAGRGTGAAEGDPQAPTPPRAPTPLLQVGAAAPARQLRPVQGSSRRCFAGAETPGAGVGHSDGGDRGSKTGAR